MNENKNTQCADVLNHLKTYGHITSWEMITDYAIIDGRRRICDLKKQGHDILAEYRTIRTRRGREARIAVYRLIEPTTPVFRPATVFKAIDGQYMLIGEKK